MRTFKNILYFTLLLAILSTGLPLYHAGDANRDDRVDLADAILRVQGVARTAEEPAIFRENLEEALITLSAVAGVRQVLKADRKTSSPPSASGINLWLPEQGYGESPPLPGRAIAPDGDFLYHSPALTLLTPPPLSV